MVNIFSDSLASVMAIHSQRVDSHHLIKDIRQIVSNLLSSGTRTNFIWIPSHVTIPGNERADELATQCLSDPASPVLSITPSTSEFLNVIHSVRISNLSRSLRLACPTLLPSSRCRMGLRPWQVHKSTVISRILHRLRSGRNRLNKTLRHFDADNDGFCPNGCPNLEDSNHVLTVCPTYEISREPLRSLVSSLKLDFALPVLIGICENIPPNSQFKIRDGVVKFLTQSGLISRI
jgi:hypothetical protein